MANEITILEGDGSFRFNLFFTFPIASPKQVGGFNVVPTPATDPVTGDNALPTIADAVLTVAEKTALDNGTAAYKVVQFRKNASLSSGQLLTLARQMYADELTDFNRWYAQTYLHAGTRVSA